MIILYSIMIVYCFFFKQKTAYELRISDWSSDVCSSDLDERPRPWGSRREGDGMTRSYSDFIASKAIDDPCTGIIDVPELPASLFPHQRDIVNWALRRGRAALFAGTGLGKSRSEARRVGKECVSQCRSRGARYN